MLQFLIISISIIIEWTNGYYLESSANYLKPQMERNNIVNKKVWVRNKYQDGSTENDKTHLGSFIFRPESMDAGLLQNVFDRFGENNMQASPMVTGYVQRARRSSDYNRHRRRSLKANKFISRKIEDAIIKSKIVSDLKPATIFNEYPYEVALLLSNADKGPPKVTRKKNVKHDKLNNTNVVEDKLKVLAINSTTNSSNTKRSKKFDKPFPKYNLVDELEDTSALTRSVYDKERIWNENNAPISDSNIYKVVTDQPDDRPKGVTERGLVKIIAMLTRSFKTIMNHYKEIINVHKRVLKISQDFDMKASEVYMKFEEFERKYADMVQYSNQIKEIGAKMDSAQEYLQDKFKNIEATVSELQSQQKTFLGQQKQFYRLQRLMAVQNEKINQKQNQIAKTQSEISHRQNNFARILKKAKQVLLDNKINNTTDNNETKVDNIPVTTTTASTLSMKINLFSIPPKSKLPNQDELIIKEKDDKQIDDLVYKYYFNNTFIDNLMKSKILNNYASQAHSVDIVRQVKNKRNKESSTIMLPMQKNTTRSKRWINSFGKNFRRHIKNDKTAKLNKIEGADKKVDPFIAMATSFCKEIGKDQNDQSLKWCVEKSLRRLKIMNTRSYSPLPVTVMSEKPQPSIQMDVNTERLATDGFTTLRAIPSKPATVVYTEDLAPVTQNLPFTTSLFPVASLQEIYFPDNEELESNLKQYEIKPDTEGNVYYDGSMHMSDFGQMVSGHDSEGTSDVMPGLMDSNSKVEIEPLAFDLQAQRRAYVNRLNEELMKKLRL